MSVVRKAAIIAAFALCVMLAAFMLWEAVAANKVAHDFAVYWRAANQPPEAAYLLSHSKPFPYPPTMLLWIAPLGMVSKAVGYLVLSLIGIAGIFMACRAYLSNAAMALTLICPPMIRCIRNGQVSAILAALLIWSCGTANRVAAGVALGVIASIKPQLVIMAPLVLVLNRDWRAFISAGGSFLAIVLVSTLAFGPNRWGEWLASMGHFHNAVAGTSTIEIAASPAAVAEMLGLPPLPFLILGIGIGAWLVFVCRDGEPLTKATAIGAGSLLAAPYAMAYDLIVIAPFIASLVMRGSIPGLIALSGMLNPIPLLVAAWELRTRVGSGRRGEVGDVDRFLRKPNLVNMPLE